MQARTKATLIGFIAVLLWSLLALFTTFASTIPPFQLMALTFGVAFGVSFIFWCRRGLGGVFRELKQPWLAYALGIGGLFGYHFFYFLALRNAPPAYAGLIAYLWPLLIVLFSALLPGEKLRWFHVAGAVLGLAGAALIVSKGNLGGFDSRFGAGYFFAVICALIWSGYSVSNRRFGDVPTSVVGLFCLACSVLAAVCHLLLETWVMPGAMAWFAILGLGLGPVGLAFFVWDYGTKHGNIQALGASAYLAPLLSTLILIVFGKAEPTSSLLIACFLIVVGAVLASKDIFFSQKA